LRNFASFFRKVADAAWATLQGGFSRFLRENVSCADEKLGRRIARARAPFWRHVRDALAERHP
jgi:hypothetical protein